MELKVAMFTDSYYPSVDGVVVSLTTTSQELKRQGHEVVVFAPEPPGGTVENLPDRVIWLPAHEFRWYHGYRSALFPSSIVSQVRREKPDIIHSHGIGFAGIQALVASRNTKIRNVFTFHTMLTEAATHYAPPVLPIDVMIRLAWIYHRNFMKRPHAVITPTNTIREELQNHRIRARRWEVIPTGVDCERFSPSISGKPVRDRLGLDGKRVVLTVGRVAREKNLDLLIAGFAEFTKKIDDAILLIAGKGPAVDYYTAMVKEMGLTEKVMFAGFVPDSELSSYYAAADAFVIASKFETQGIAPLEAMATGKRVACMNSRALAEIIQDGKNGYLFEDEPASCAKAIDRAIDDADHISGEARKTALGLSLENCTRKLLGLYQELSGKS